MVMFKGEKTVPFYLGVLALGYSIYQFCILVWTMVYYLFINPYPPEFIVGLFASLIPEAIGGVIFLIIGLYLMKVGTKKIEPVLEENEEENLEKS